MKCRLSMRHANSLQSLQSLIAEQHTTKRDAGTTSRCVCWLKSSKPKSINSNAQGPWISSPAALAKDGKR